MTSPTERQVITMLCQTVAEAAKPPANPGGGRPPPPDPNLYTLKKDLKKLTEAWSEMAIRNLLMDIRRRINLLKPTVTGADELFAEINTRIRDALGKHGKSRYDSVVCVGYRVKTTAPSFNGKPDDWDDLRTRCDEMKKAIRAAYTLSMSVPEASHANVLKVFMAPEFFFRGRNGAYDHAVATGQAGRTAEAGVSAVQEHPGLMDMISEEISSPIYKNWLFVLGTVICATRYSETACAVCNGKVEFEKATPDAQNTTPFCKSNRAHTGTKEAIKVAAIDNVALVCKEGEVHTVSKELVSHVDFKTTPKVKDLVKVGAQWLPVGRAKQVSGYDSASNVRPKFQDERMGGNVLTIDGITIGLEVCLDHAASSSKSSAGRLQHAGNIQLQLVPSGGMSLCQLRTVDDGIAFNVDGAAPHAQVVVKNTTPQTLYNQKGWVVAANWKDAIKKIDKGGGLGVDSTPVHSAAAARGRVVLFGPYALPGV